MDSQDAALEAELASFTARSKQLQSSEVPGQLDLTDLTDHLSDDSEGP